MRKRKLLIYIVFYLVALGSCTEPYEFTINDYEDILIVQGMITNEEGPYKVVLSRTIPVNSSLNYFEENATVTIIVNDNIIEELNEISPGVYVTRDNFEGEIGNMYQLHIKTLDNVEYESDIMVLNDGIELESVYTHYNELYDFERNEMVRGIDIKVNTKTWEDDIADNVYLKWDFEEIWAIEQKWNVLEFIDGDWNFTIDTNQYTCWKYDYSIDINIDNIFKYSSNKIDGKLITHLSYDSPKPFYGYSILVKQYSINEIVYKFWEIMKENSLDNREIFNNIPCNAESNIYSCDDKHKVYGYFDACFLSKQRIFLKSPVEGIEFRDFNSECKKHSAPWSYVESRNVYILLWDIDEVFYTTQQYCVDCSVVSSTTQKPDFWIY